MSADGFRYIGSELELFAAARNWKAYWSARLRPLLSGHVLEVGAGIGSNLVPLDSPAVTGWTLLEPDPELVARMRARQAAGELPSAARLCTGTLAGLAAEERFDTIVYIDVMEHIADDRGEAARAAGHLAPGGRLVLLCPAHPFLFSPFDAAIGHHRRYSRAALAALAPPGCRLETCFMLDSIGLFALLANRLLLKSAMPSAAQIAFWDRAMVPLSRLLDPLFGHRLGKTVVGAWVKAA